MIEPCLLSPDDNCGENKNKTLCALLTDQVCKKVFAKIRASFFMVGRTHDDIDQLFATIASHLRQIHISCPDKESLYNTIQDAFRKLEDKPTIFPLGATDVFDYTEFYKSIVNKPSPTIKFLANLEFQSFKRLHRMGKLCFFITETGSKVATSCLNLIAWQRLLRKLQKVNLLEANVLKKFVRLFVQDFIKHP